MRSARVQLFTYAVSGIACAHAFRQDAAHTTLAENRWVSWIWFVEDRSWPYFPPCALDYTFVYCPKRRSGRRGLFTLGFAGRRRPVPRGVRVVAAYLEGDLRVVGDGCRGRRGLFTLGFAGRRGLLQGRSVNREGRSCGRYKQGDGV